MMATSIVNINGIEIKRVARPRGKRMTPEISVNADRYAPRVGSGIPTLSYHSIMPPIFLHFIIAGVKNPTASISLKNNKGRSFNLDNFSDLF